MRTDRRLFLLGTLGTLASAPARRRAAAERTLVVLQLTGGNDGLSTLVPHADERYAEARRSTRLASDEVLPLDARLGLHPRLLRLRALYERGRLALVQGLGYPAPDRSHFRSMDIWHAADARGRGLGSGWLGRCAEALGPQAPHAFVHLGARPPFLLHSALHPPLCLTPAFLRAADPERSRARAAAAALAGPTSGGGAGVELVRAAWARAEASLDVLRGALEPGRAGPRYPETALAEDLRAAARLIHAEVGLRACSVELDGFDTHREQRGRHDRLMRELDGALGAFLEDLELSQAGRGTVVLVFSEFGRRVAENDSRGTDHGAAGLGLVLGAPVKGGLHGREPDLGALEDGDLAFTTDFRALYAALVAGVFALQPAHVLGTVPEPLDVL